MYHIKCDLIRPTAGVTSNTTDSIGDEMMAYHPGFHRFLFFIPPFTFPFFYPSELSTLFFTWLFGGDRQRRQPETVEGDSDFVCFIFQTFFYCLLPKLTDSEPFFL